MKRVWAEVLDDTHRNASGAIVPDGMIKLDVPDIAGDVPLWLPPIVGPVVAIPRVGEFVSVVQNSKKQMWWEFDGDNSRFASDATGDYPNRVVLPNRDGSRSVTLDNLLVRLGTASASSSVVTWNELKPILEDMILANQTNGLAIGGHVHLGGTLALGLTGTPNPGTWVNPVTADTDVGNDTPAATNVVAN